LCPGWGLFVHAKLALATLVIKLLFKGLCDFFVLVAVREDRMPGGRNSGAVYNLYKVPVSNFTDMITIFTAVVEWLSHHDCEWLTIK